MIEKLAFGRTGHQSTRIIFGAAALGAMRQDRADLVLELIMEHGINHIDVAASYGEAELRLAPLLAEQRQRFFLATKTGERSGDAARRQLESSLTRLGVDQIDLIQMHNLTDETGWQSAMADDGALAALIRAKEEGLVRFIGVTGHGTFAPSMHLKSLARYDFDSVLVPYNFSMRQQPDYTTDLDLLIRTCLDKQVAVQTIKAIARRRWTEDDADKRFSWYMPIRDPEPLARAMAYVLAEPGLFLNTTSDASILPAILNAANLAQSKPSDIEMSSDQATLGIEPLFVRGVSDDVRVAQL
jgi:aryl-alcohol dehydrogenase-like predicted oxidoreductase